LARLNPDVIGETMLMRLLLPAASTGRACSAAHRNSHERRRADVWAQLTRTSSRDAKASL